MRVVVVKRTRAEAGDIARRYEGERPGRGEVFLDAVADALRSIGEHPLAFAVWPDLTPTVPPLRRYVMRRFPYALGYVVHPDHVRVAVLTHMHRLPGYWR